MVKLTNEKVVFFGGYFDGDNAVVELPVIAEKYVDPVSLLSKKTFNALRKRFLSQEFEDDDYDM